MTTNLPTKVLKRIADDEDEVATLTLILACIRDCMDATPGNTLLYSALTMAESYIENERNNA